MSKKDQMDAIQTKYVVGAIRGHDAARLVEPFIAIIPYTKDDELQSKMGIGFDLGDPTTPVFLDHAVKHMLEQCQSKGIENIKVMAVFPDYTDALYGPRHIQGNLIQGKPVADFVDGLIGWTKNLSPDDKTADHYFNRMDARAAAARAAKKPGGLTP